jgi:hypothetical protein
MGSVTGLTYTRQGEYYGQGTFGAGGFGGPLFGPIYKEPLSYYLALVTSQYKLSPNFITWLSLALQPIDDLTNCLAFLSNNFDLDSAVGIQLDNQGQLIGQTRTVGFQPSDGVSPVLDDNTYRILLKARIAFNQWNGKIASMYPIWKSLFSSGNIIVHDNQDMTATIILSGAFTSIIQDLIVNGYIIPRPEGVQYTFSFATLPILGADENNSFIAGADLGHAS